MKDHGYIVHEYKGRLNNCSFLAQMEHVKLCHKQFLFDGVHSEVLQAAKTVEVNCFQKKCIWLNVKTLC